MKNPDRISESLVTIFFWVKILEFFDTDPGSWIRDGKNLDPGSGIRDGKIGIWDGKNSDVDPGSATLEISLPNLLGLKEPNNNQTL
jgi:hypothetical protein